MGSSTLTVSQTLLGLGWFCALGTIELDGLKAELYLDGIVGLGHPFHEDDNNGVHVINDEIGRPWIKKRHDIDRDEVAQIRRALPDGEAIVHGCNVPHSNDGGYFMREILPALMRGDKESLIV